MRRLPVAFLGLLLFSVFTQCSQTPSVPLVNPPFPDLDVPYETFTFKADEGGVFRLPTGTKISIPPDALVDEAGNTVAGEVDLKFREMHDKSEVFRSGITMRYDSAEARGQFETAGMFDIAAFQGEQPLQLRPGKTAAVDLASHDPDSDYSFYKLDEEKGGWQFRQRSKADTNYYKKRLLDSLDAVEIAPFGDEYFAFNYSCLLDVYFGENASKIYKYRNSSYVRRKIEAYGARYLEGFYPPRILHVRSGRRQPLAFWLWRFDQPERLPQWVNDGEAKADIKKVSTGVYRLSFQKRKDAGTTWERTIYPIIPIRQMYAHTPEDWRENFTEYLKDAQNSAMEDLLVMEKAIQRAQMQADFIRSVKLDGFGIYNYDRLAKEPNKIALTARFRLEDGTELQGNQTIWLIPKDENSVIQWHLYDGEVGNVYLVPERSLRICAVSLEKNQMYVFSEEDFAQLDFDRMRSEKAYTFSLKTHPQTINSYEDIRAALGMPPAQQETEPETPAM